MKLLAYILNGEILGVEKTSWNDDEFTGITFSACTDTTTIPSNYSDISNIYNWGRFGEEAGLTYVEVRNEIKKHIPSDLSTLSVDEMNVLVHYNLYNYFKIYDRINNGDVIVGEHPPLDVDYDLLGYSKKRTFNKGELERVEYYENFVPSSNTYTVKVIEEICTYYRINQMLSRREMKINWMLDDGTTGYTRNTTKYYTLIEAIQAGETRRANLISDLKINVIGLLMQFSGASSVMAQQVGTPFLDTYSTEISKFIQGFEQQLKDSIATDTTFNWLNLVIPNTGGMTIRQYLISELTIDYTINNTYM